MRCGHFAAALTTDGHEVLIVRCDNSAPARALRVRDLPGVPVAGREVGVIEASEPAFESELLRSRIRAFGPDALVGATVYAASLALRLRLDVPLWADVFGDFMAEAQAKAVVANNDAVIARFWQMLLPVLERADRFSCVSGRQRWALLGQLGLAGRLSSATAGEDLVSVVPCAAEAPVGGGESPLRKGVEIPRDAFLVVWTGTFNTWCDVDVLFAGLELAMRREPRLQFVATGGEVPGHDETTYARFERLVAQSGLSERFHLLGWIDRGALFGLIAEADVGIIVERPLPERYLGSENRVAEWAAAGLPCVTTGLSEFGAAMVERGLAFGVPPGDPERLAATLCELIQDPGRLERAAGGCAAEAASRLSPERTAEPLVAWCRKPVFAGDRGRSRPVSVGLFSEPSSLAHMLEAYLAGLSWGQIFYRSARWFGRRLVGRGRRWG
ncbi:MAG: glycosyltransferase [Deltaproteobacteria bacterium]|nr:MAG: glycosyltransferase [Deltaproteobacteria bacterium]